MPEETVTIPCGAITLEGRLSRPNGATAGVVVCHPHPQYGGDQDNPVVTAICDAATGRGLATLRFNFRGTGASGGSHSGGHLEVDDVQAAVAFLAAALDSPAPRLGLAGYSFGAMMALAAGLDDPRIAAVAAVSPPLSMRPEPGLESPVKPLLLVTGSDDQFVGIGDLEAVAAHSPELVRLRVVEGADHFWWDALGEPPRLVGEFFAECLASGDR